MKTPGKNAATMLLPFFSTSAYAEQVELPVPFLEWSFYILLIFGFVVAIGIFFRRGKNGKNEPLSQLLAAAERKVHAVDPDISVTECVQRMNDLQIGAMLVIRDDELVGIFTERDALTRVLGAGLEPSHTKISAVMTGNPVCVSPSTPLNEARMIITNQRIRHLPVVQDGKVLGMISSGDLTHWLVRDQPSEIRDLVDTSGD
jgi:signal-transduction protein with cAMP-binding, CBS, and nucleotidyltransferase domain